MATSTLQLPGAAFARQRRFHHAVRAERLPRPWQESVGQAGHTFALVSPCGYGNLGDAAIQDAVIAFLRRTRPNARIVGITLNPQDTRERHGIQAFPISAGSKAYYAGIDIEVREGVQLAPTARTNRARVGACLGACKSALKRMLPTTLNQFLWRLKREVRHLARAHRFMREVDTLIFTGGGQLDEFWGGPWGHPYAMVQWALLAKLRGARVLFLSVGVGSLDNRLSRCFVRSALALANYRSFRDAGSRNLCRQAGAAAGGPVYPDLAYSFPEHELPAKRETGDAELSVGVSPICYCDPRVWPKRHAAAYRSYLCRLAQAVEWLLKMNCRVVLFTSDGPDQRIVADLLSALDSQLAPEQRANIRECPTTTVQGFLETVASVDLLVASRLHGVLLAHLVGTPVLALSYDRKVEVQMAQMEQMDFCLNIDRFDLHSFQAAFTVLRSKRGELGRAILQRVARFRARLEHQYAAVLGCSCVRR